MKMHERIIEKLKSKKCELTEAERKSIVDAFTSLECFRKEDNERQLKYGR